MRRWCTNPVARGTFCQAFAFSEGGSGEVHTPLRQAEGFLTSLFGVMGMNARFLIVVGVTAAGIVGGTLAATANAETATSSSWSAPRTAWGDPDLEGTWTNATATPLERPKELEGKLVLTATWMVGTAFGHRLQVSRDCVRTGHRASPRPVRATASGPIMRYFSAFDVGVGAANVQVRNELDF